jgi:hypothetical protein
MTLLSICRSVTDAVGLQRQSVIVTSQDQLARQLLELATQTLEELSLMDWPILMRAGTVTTVVDQTQYALPADFEHQIGDTFYASARYEQLRGQLTPGQWALQRNALPDLGRFKFRIFGNPLKINIIPAPQVVEDFVYEYKTSNRTTSGATYTADTDVSLVPEELVKKGLQWRIRRAKGLDYTEEFNAYENAYKLRLAQQMQFGSIPVAVRSGQDAPLTNGYVPETGFG